MRNHWGHTTLRLKDVLIRILELLSIMLLLSNCTWPLKYGLYMLLLLPLVAFSLFCWNETLSTF